jgi:hypothetical protein
MADESGYGFYPPPLPVSSIPADNGSYQAVSDDSAAVSQGEVRVFGSAGGRGTVNPDRGEQAMIVFTGTALGRFELRIFTLNGELVYEAAQDNISDGTFEWGPRDVASGIYIAHVRGPGINTKKRIAIIK